jgi:hypothetical protein
VSELVKVLDDVIARYAGGEHQVEAAAARAAFLRATGNVADDEPLFEERITAFLEWYALERKMDGSELRPIDRYPREVSLSAEAGEAARALATSHWSLFQCEEVTPGRAIVSDLLGGGRFVVHERRKLPGLEQGDVFEGRLVSEGGKTLFGRSFCFHPRDAAPTIQKFVLEAAKAGDAKQDVLFRLAERKMRCERYHNVQVAKVYAYGRGAE